MSELAKPPPAPPGSATAQQVLNRYTSLWQELARPLYAHAERLITAYLEHSEAVRRSKPQAEWARYRPRMEAGEAGPRLYWEQKLFRPGARGQRIAQWGKIGRSGHPTRYPPSVFRAAPAWEKQLALTLEQEFQKIREYVRTVVTMRRTVEASARKYGGLMAEFGSETGEGGSG